jgi:hypothetical protein
VKRYTPGLCANNLHELDGPETVVTNSRGEEECKGCYDASKVRFLQGQARKNKTSFCRRGHEYTVDNTYWNPASGRRTCMECQRIARRASFARLKGNKP